MINYIRKLLGIPRKYHWYSIYYAGASVQASAIYQSDQRYITAKVIEAKAIENKLPPFSWAIGGVSYLGYMTVEEYRA
jgi:hypothetical protein